jgi:butyrate response factor
MIDFFIFLLLLFFLGTLYKTEICQKMQQRGACAFGNKCQFAHGIHELRPAPRHPKWKMTRCKSFWTTGTCPYEKRCHFLYV